MSWAQPVKFPPKNPELYLLSGPGVSEELCRNGQYPVRTDKKCLQRKWYQIMAEIALLLTAEEVQQAGCEVYSAGTFPWLQLSTFAKFTTGRDWSAAKDLPLGYVSAAASCTRASHGSASRIPKSCLARPTGECDCIQTTPWYAQSNVATDGRQTTRDTILPAWN